MKRILVTGSTVKVGSAVIDALRNFENILVREAVRDVDPATATQRSDTRLEKVRFDFLDGAS